MNGLLGPIRLAGERITLREFVAADEDAVHSYASDPLVTRLTLWGPNSPEQTREFLAHAIAQSEGADRQGFDLAVVDTGSQSVIGGAALQVTSSEHRRGEIGYVIHPDFWSRGLATEAAEALLRFGFEQLCLRRISATCDPDNRASATVLRKAGLRFEGLLRSHLLLRGSWRDSLLFAAIDDDWRSRR